MAALMIIMLEDLVEFFNLGKNMSGQQIAHTASMIVKDFNFLKIEDFRVCFDRLKKGHYGRLFDRLDGQIVFECLSAYSHERALEAERMNLDAHGKKKKEPISPELKEFYLKTLKKIKSELPDEPKPVVKKTRREPTEREMKIQELFREFHERSKKEGRQLQGKDYLDIESDGVTITVDCVEYVELKLKQAEL